MNNKQNVISYQPCRVIDALQKANISVNEINKVEIILVNNSHDELQIHEFHENSMSKHHANFLQHQPKTLQDKVREVKLSLVKVGLNEGQGRFIPVFQSKVKCWLSSRQVSKKSVRKRPNTSHG